MFNFMFSLSLSSSCVCLNVCCDPTFLTVKSNEGYIIIIIIIIIIILTIIIIIITMSKTDEIPVSRYAELSW